MLLQPVTHHYYGLAQVCREICRDLDTTEKLAVYMDLDRTTPIGEVTMRFTKVVANQPFVVCVEDLVATPRGSAILNIALGRSSKLDDGHNYTSTDDQPSLPIAATLRSGDKLDISAATLAITITHGDGGDRRSITKNKDYTTK